MKKQKYLVQEKCIICGCDLKSEKYSKTITKYCNSCYREKGIINIKAQSGKKPKNNTNGFLGVTIVYKNWGNFKIWGINSRISAFGKNIFSKRYKDDLASKETMIKAAVDRDLFIIENNLPHTKNFNDKELEEYKKLLGY